MVPRTLGQLLDVDSVAWPVLCHWFRGSNNLIEVLPASALSRGEALQQTQVTVRSPLGSIVYETGGLLIDHGWLRVLGSGHPRLPRTLPEWNRGRSTGPEGHNGFYLIADDVVGGFYGLDGGALGDGKGDVFYFAPDTLAWEPLHFTYAEFINWALMGDLNAFYEPFRWPGWETEALATIGDRAIVFSPPLSISGPPLAERQRRSTTVADVYALHARSAPAQLHAVATA